MVKRNENDLTKVYLTNNAISETLQKKQKTAKRHI